MKKITAFVTACAAAFSITAFANDYTYEYNDFVANVVVPESGVCDISKSYAGYESDYTASEYFSGIISAFRADLDNDGNSELVLVGDNAVRVYKISEGEPTFAGSYITTLVCDYGESFANVFLKTYDGREYLCVETFEDNSSGKAYSFKMMYLSTDGSKLANLCSIEKEVEDDYTRESASAKIDDSTKSYSTSTINGTTTSVNPNSYADLYDAAQQMLSALDFSDPSFLNTVNRLNLDENDTGMHFQITNLISDVTLETYVRASGVRVSSKPVVYFEDYSELQTLMQAPEETAEPVETTEPVETAEPVESETPAEAETPAETDKFSVEIDGAALAFSNQEPIMVNDRVLVPMRDIFEALGAEVMWLGKYSIVFAQTDTTSVVMKIDDSAYYVNGEEKETDTAPQIYNGSTMIPARIVAESLGCSVDWNQDTQTVVITTGA
ncbi:MAG: copper amine oxidase N-terminal domain-containing protein [Firmicutes bacterium]|nr:copper amine oxidase N-terminal domain-containing protein [Bacillota bacterium]